MLIPEALLYALVMLLITHWKISGWLRSMRGSRWLSSMIAAATRLCAAYVRGVISRFLCLDRAFLYLSIYLSI